MPEALNGIGTAFYGHRDERPDGSYVTTEWFVLVHFPVVPLGSYRVWELESQLSPLSFSGRYRAEPVPLSVRQVLCTWAAAVVVAGPFAGILGVLSAGWSRLDPMPWALALVGSATVWPFLCFAVMYLVSRRRRPRGPRWS